MASKWLSQSGISLERGVVSNQAEKRPIRLNPRDMSNGAGQVPFTSHRTPAYGRHSHTEAVAHVLPTVKAALRDVAVILAIGDGECGHFATLAGTKEDRKQVEGPGVMGKEND